MPLTVLFRFPRFFRFRLLSGLFLAFEIEHLLDLPVHPALMGAYEDLLGPEGDGAAAEGP